MYLFLGSFVVGTVFSVALFLGRLIIPLLSTTPCSDEEVGLDESSSDGLDGDSSDNSSGPTLVHSFGSFRTTVTDAGGSERGARLVSLFAASLVFSLIELMRELNESADFDEPVALLSSVLLEEVGFF